MTSPSPDLVWRAGARALDRIRRHGLDPGAIRTVILPASGPRWIALAALDRVLLDRGWIAPRPGDPRRVLIGASAGAWRALALACPDAGAAHHELLESYVGQVFDSGVTPVQVSAAYRRMLGTILTEERVTGLVERPDLGAVVLTDRARGPAGSSRRSIQWLGLAVCAACNWLSTRLPTALLSPVAVASRPEDVPVSFSGSVARLGPDNATDVALASGTLPFVMAPVTDPARLPSGRYLDGGLLDYHVRRRWNDPDDGVTLLLHVAGPIRPGWFDRWWPRRSPPKEVLDDLVVLEPSADFLARLPDGRLPDRHDFFRFADDPEPRLRRWREAAARGTDLAEAFTNGSAPDTIARSVRPIRSVTGA